MELHLIAVAALILSVYQVLAETGNPKPKPDFKNSPVYKLCAEKDFVSSTWELYEYAINALEKKIFGKNHKRVLDCVASNIIEYGQGLINEITNANNNYKVVEIYDYAEKQKDVDRLIEPYFNATKISRAKKFNGTANATEWGCFYSKDSGLKCVYQPCSTN